MSSRFRIVTNGFEVQFTNGFKAVYKHGYGTATTHNQSDDMVERFTAAKFGGMITPDIEVQIFDNLGNDISDKFTRVTFLNAEEFAHLTYIVSRLKPV